mmetsp:Transcript_105280/g.293093  ORF Transcript_105280/g.293093 Transcript_105280/m.293093 type:complete len:203 (-) Transcript_105280:596-1204(-)
MACAAPRPTEIAKPRPRLRCQAPCGAAAAAAAAELAARLVRAVAAPRARAQMQVARVLGQAQAQALAPRRRVARTAVCSRPIQWTEPCRRQPRPPNVRRRSCCPRSSPSGWTARLRLAARAALLAAAARVTSRCQRRWASGPPSRPTSRQPSAAAAGRRASPACFRVRLRRPAAATRTLLTRAKAARCGGPRSSASAARSWN